MKLYYFTTAHYGLSNIAKQRLKVATLHDMNDPFELLCVNARHKQTRQALRRLKDWAHREFGVLCFSPHWRNLLMWSHYADRHRGVALELDVDSASVIDVQYTNVRVDWDVPKILSGGGFTTEHAEAIFKTKASHWEYEEERRVVIKLREAHREEDMYFERVSPTLRIVGIVLGPLCAVTDRQLRAVIPSGQKFGVTRSRLAFKSFDVVSDKARKPRALIGAGP